MRLIDADALAEKMKNLRNARVTTSIRYVVEAPTIDAVPARHGRWIATDRYGFPVMECSECGAQTGTLNFPYCFNCGAKMAKEDGADD